jgi:two-component system sensor histidine kinase PilS (NtrC family)
VQLGLIRQRWPGVLIQTYCQFGFDLITVILLQHASGGIDSAIGGLLVISIGTLALLVPLDRALLLASVTTFALLGEQSLSYLRGFTDSGGFGATGILAAVIFVITGVVQLLRKQIVDIQAIAAQRGVDLQNLVELNEYIIQHLRESIVVVDADNRIRLLNESGAGLLGIRADAHGRELASVAPTLEARLNLWRDGQDSTTESTFVLESDQNATKIEPHFARLGSDRDINRKTKIMKNMAGR